MNIEIKYRKSLCDEDTFYYELYVNDIWVCGYYSLEILKRRIAFILRTGRFDLKGINNEILWKV